MGLEGSKVFKEWLKGVKRGLKGSNCGQNGSKRGLKGSDMLYQGLLGVLRDHIVVKMGLKESSRLQ